MAPIIITPGTFAPVPATGALRAAYWPVFPAPRPWQLKEDYQFQPRPEQPEEVVSYPIVRTSRDYMSGALEIGIGPVPDEDLVSFLVTGARYVPNGTYAPAGFTTPPGVGRLYATSTGDTEAAAAAVDLGSFTIPYAEGFPLDPDSGRIIVRIPWEIVLEGLGDSGTYTTLGPEDFGGDPTALSGEAALVLVAATEPHQPGWEENVEVTRLATVVLTLFRDAEIYDRVAMSVVFTAALNYVPSVDPLPDSEIVDAGFTLQDTLYGASSPVLLPSLPLGLPLAGYYREARHSVGTLTP